MFGFLIAVALFGLQFWVKNELLETAFVGSIQFLFWWYVLAGALTISVAALAWAGDLGTEGARLRHGISGSLGWMLGLPRVPLYHKGALYFLMTRRWLLGVGAYLLTRGLQSVGATFEWGEGVLWAGGITLGIGLLALVFVPLMRKSVASLSDRIGTTSPTKPDTN